MEEEPRILEFRGDELPRVSHAYGTNCIITENEISTGSGDLGGGTLAGDDFDIGVMQGFFARTSAAGNAAFGGTFMTISCLCKL